MSTLGPNPIYCFFSRDPGGTALLAQVYKLDLDGSQKHFFTRDFGSAVLQTENIPHTLVPAHVTNDEAFEKFIARQGLDDSALVFICATSNVDDNLEQLAWRYASQNNLPCHVFLDQVFRLKNRFQANKLPQQKIQIKTLFTPTKLKNSLDEFSIDVDEQISIGFLDLNNIPKIDPLSAKKEIAQKYSLDADRPLFLFICEPESEIVGFEKLKYSSVEIINSLNKQLEQIYGKSGFNLLLKIHPKQQTLDLPGYIQIRNEFDTNKLLAGSSVVIGIKSILLLKALFLARKILILDYLNSEDEKVFTELFPADSRLGSLVDLTLIRAHSTMDSTFKNFLVGLSKNWEKLVVEKIALRK